MLQEHRTYIKPDMKMALLTAENPRLLLLLEHLEIDFVVGERTVAQLCSTYSLPVDLFLVLGNLYNGFYPEPAAVNSIDDIAVIIRFLRKSHEYYKTEKYPEIIGFIKELQARTGNHEVKLIDRFFREYFDEVLEHLDYEENTAFPYFLSLTGQGADFSATMFTVREYGEHHTDIETKLADLKNLLLKHINVSGELSLRRRLFFALLELEYDLQIHALIEEKILLPLIAGVEKNRIESRE
jgi:regulator of cell morphogenesis and NO signaling